MSLIILFSSVNTHFFLNDSISVNPTLHGISGSVAPTGGWGLETIKGAIIDPLLLKTTSLSLNNQNSISYMKFSQFAQAFLTILSLHNFNLEYFQRVV